MSNTEKIEPNRIPNTRAVEDLGRISFLDENGAIAAAVGQPYEYPVKWVNDPPMTLDTVLAIRDFENEPMRGV